VPVARGGENWWFVVPDGRIKGRIYSSSELSAHPLLVVVLHGEIPKPPPAYHYDFAQAATEGFDAVVSLPKSVRPIFGEGPGIRDLVAAALLRPIGGKWVRQIRDAERTIVSPYQSNVGLGCTRGQSAARHRPYAKPRSSTTKASSAKTSSQRGSGRLPKRGRIRPKYHPATRIPAASTSSAIRREICMRPNHPAASTGATMSALISTVRLAPVTVRQEFEYSKAAFLTEAIQWVPWIHAL
jgi:hypothetical protein